MKKGTKLNLVLLIDDDPINNFINKRLLLQLHISNEIVIANNCLEGLNYLQTHYYDKNQPNLFLVDINMPVMDGFEFIENYNRFPEDKKQELKLAILTSSINQADIEKSLSLGVKAFFTKPLTTELIEKIISEE